MPADAVMVLDDAGQTLLVAGMVDNGVCGMAHVDDQDFQQIRAMLGLDERTVFPLNYERLVLGQDGRLIAQEPA